MSAFECNINYFLFSSASLFSCVVNRKVTRKLCENVKILYLGFLTLEHCCAEKKSESGINWLLLIFLCIHCKASYFQQPRYHPLTHKHTHTHRYRHLHTHKRTQESTMVFVSRMVCAGSRVKLERGMYTTVLNWKFHSCFHLSASSYPVTWGAPFVISKICIIHSHRISSSSVITFSS